MFGIFLALFLAGILVVIVRLTQEKEDKNPVLLILLTGYFLRLLVRCFNRSLDVFSAGQTLGGNDAVNYEATANQIVHLWDTTGIRFVTNPEVDVGAASFPHNLLAFVQYLNGGYSAVGSVSIVAFLACLTALVLYRVYIIYDFDRKFSFYVTISLIFMPSFIVFTSDSYKDGILIFFTVTIFSIFAHCNHKNWVVLAPCFFLCCFGLLGTRYYLVYALTPCVVIWIFRGQIKQIFNLGSFFASAFFFSLLAIIFLGLYFNVMDVDHSTVYASAQKNLNELINTSISIQADNIYSGGSLVEMDGKMPTLETYPMKILYTLFSPFPWQAGSFGLHLSKIEMLFWCFILYWAFRGSLIFLKRDPAKVLMLLSFIVGLTLVYSWSFTNIGQIYRQRLVIFFVASILAVWGRVAAKQKAQVS